MCTRGSVFGRCVGRGYDRYDHPRLRKPSEGGRKGPFALAYYQQQVVSGKQCFDAAGVCSFNSSPASRLARRIVILSHPATSAVVAGWAVNKALLFLFPGGPCRGNLDPTPPNEGGGGGGGIFGDEPFRRRIDR